MRVPGGHCATVMFAIAAVGASYLVCAETVYRHDTVAAVRWAVRLDAFAPPAHYSERLAELDDENAARALNAALKANPRLTPALIARALAAERQGRRADAERDLREAARIDRQYLPAWTLANFFFREKDRANFWAWARRAALLTDDYRPLLRLANAREDHPGAEHAKEVLAQLGGGEALERTELDDLLAQGDMEGVQFVARALARGHDRSDKVRMETVVDRQIRTGRDRDALELWNAFATTHEQALDPAKGRFLTNGDFARLPGGLGFDWRMKPADGLAAQWQPFRIVFSLSGAQPELCVLLEQFLPLRAARLRLSFEYVAALDAPTGVRWNLDGEDGPMLKPSPEQRESSVVFGEAKARLGRLVLLYRRETGSPRTPGRIEIGNVRMETF